MEKTKIDKVRENFSRRRAARLGLMLKKSRGKKWSIDNKGGYSLITFDNIIHAGEKYDLTIEQVEALLDVHEKQMRRP